MTLVMEEKDCEQQLQGQENEVDKNTDFKNTNFFFKPVVL